MHQNMHQKKGVTSNNHVIVIATAFKCNSNVPEYKSRCGNENPLPNPVERGWYLHYFAFKRVISALLCVETRWCLLHFCTYLLEDVISELLLHSYLQYNFPKMKGAGGSKAVLNFPKIHPLRYCEPSLTFQKKSYLNSYFCMQSVHFYRCIYSALSA